MVLGRINKMVGFPSFVSSRECLACQGCCRFRELKSPWRPRVSVSEIELMRAAGAAAADFDGGYVRARERGGQVQCVFFVPTQNACRIYEDRPLECRLYPFLFFKKEGRAWVGVHLSCPAVQERRHSHFFTDYLGQLKGYFQGRGVTASLKGHLALGGNYAAGADEIEELFPLDVE